MDKEDISDGLKAALTRWYHDVLPELEFNDCDEVTIYTSCFLAGSNATNDIFRGVVDASEELKSLGVKP